MRPAGVAEKLHPVSTHLHPGQEVPEPGSNGNGSATMTATATATMTKTEAISASKAKGYTGNACAECGQLTMIRNGACEKCDSCGATSGCS